MGVFQFGRGCDGQTSPDRHGLLLLPCATRRRGHDVRAVLSHAAGNCEEEKHAERGVRERRKPTGGWRQEEAIKAGVCEERSASRGRALPEGAGPAGTTAGTKRT